MDRVLDTKVAYISGAASGIGLELARAFAQAGAKIVLSDLNGTAAQEKAAALVADGFDAVGLGCYVAVEEEMKSSIDQTIQRFGKLDTLTI